MRVFQHDQYPLEPGGNLDVGLDGYQAAYIRIDNLSNSWLFVESSAQRYVRPLCLGWWARLVPAQSVIKVSSVAAPPGGIQSQNTGGNVLVDVYEQDMSGALGGNNDGVLTTASAIAVSKTTNTDALTTDPVPGTQAQTVILAAPGVGLRYRIYEVSSRKNSIAAAALMACISINYSGVVGGTGFMNLGIGANQMADHENFGDDGYALPENDPIAVNVRCDVANVPFTTQVLYTIESA